MSTKKCSKCNHFKLLDEYHPTSRKGVRSGLRSDCKSCESLRFKDYAERNKSRAVETPDSKACSHCKEVKAAAMFSKHLGSRDHLDGICRKCKIAKNREFGKRRDIRAHNLRKYNLTVAEYEAMLIAQAHKCAICEGDLRQHVKGQRGYVDHDHESGKVRALLCNRCNSRLSGVEDIAFREKALAYLQSHQ